MVKLTGTQKKEAPDSLSNSPFCSVFLCLFSFCSHWTLLPAHYTFPSYPLPFP